MNGILDDFLVGLVLMISAGYAIFSLGPRSLRSRTFTALSNLMARAPAFLGLGRMARWLVAVAADKSEAACGGCDSCGSEKTPPSTGAASEVRVPLAKIGKRLGRANDYSGVDFEQAYLNRQTVVLEGLEVPVISLQDLIVNKRASGRTQDLADVEKLTSSSQLEERNSNEK